MTAKEELIAYLENLPPEQVEEALTIASAWLLERQEAKPRPLQREF